MPTFRSGGSACSIVVAVALLAVALPACGEENDSEEPRAAAAAFAGAPPPLPPPQPPRRPVAAKWSSERLSRTPVYANAEGVLVRRDGSKVRGWGDRPVRRYVTALFARMQYDFLTGSMGSVCKHIDSRLLFGFPPNGGIDDAPCESKMEAYAQQLEKDGFRSPPLRFLWVRTYPGVAGIWVEDPRGDRFRVPFVQEGNDRWLLQLGKLRRPETLAMPLRVKGS